MAAAHLIERNLEPLILETGPSAGSAVREWSHARLFSTWAEVAAPTATKLLTPTGWAIPDGATCQTSAGPVTGDVGANEPVAASGGC